MYTLIGSPFLHAAFIYILLICIRSSDMYQHIAYRTSTNVETARMYLNMPLLVTAG